jgi:hypothetical protein
MNEKSLPIQSNKTLLKASGFAFTVAVLALVMVILPSEYNIDPTGFGKFSGLSQLSAGASTSTTTLDSISAAKPKAAQQDTVTIEVLAGEGLEYKFYLTKHQKLEYTWYTDGQPIYFDFHGEPEGDTTGFFESYSIATTNKMQGTLTTPFAGSHGWYWRNDSNTKIIITLNTKGLYKTIGLK